MVGKSIHKKLTLVLFLFLAGFYFSTNNITQYPQQKVLSEKINTPKVDASIEAKPIKGNTETPKTVKLSKPHYVIVAYGDSMIETMGDGLDYLDKIFKEKYPDTTFKMYNYGIGGQNVFEGLSRFANSFNYKTRNYPSVANVKPDIIILGSFAYNPFSPHDRDRNWILMGELVSEAKKTGADVYLLAEIAPLSTGFGKGPHGANWSENLAHTQADHIIEILENSINLSRELNTGLINVYDASRVDSKYGKSIYVDPNDGIHPSIAGEELMAQVIANTIKLK